MYKQQQLSQEFAVRIRGSRKGRINAILEVDASHVTCSIDDNIEFARPLHDCKSYAISKGRLTLYMPDEHDASIIAVDIWHDTPASIIDCIIESAGAERAGAEGVAAAA